MLDFFQTITDALSTLFSLISNLVTGLVQFLAMIPQVFVFMGTASAFIPTFMVAFFVASISISVMLVVINRKE